MNRSDHSNHPKPVPTHGSSFLKGLMVGMVLGVALCAGVALYVMRLHNPFTPHADQASVAPDKPAADMPDVSRHGLINPSPMHPDLLAPAAPSTAPATGATAPTDTAAIAPPVPLPAPAPLPITEPAVTYFVQTGAFQKQAEADNQRARLALTGVDATILSPEVGEKPLYRVRVGPIVSVDEVRTLVATLKNNGIPTNIIRVDNTKTKPY